MTSKKYHMSMSPHMHRGVTLPVITSHILMALMLPAIAGVYYFGWCAVKIIVLCTAAAVASEAGMQRLMGKRIAVADGHALLTGLTLSLMLPPGVPWWIAVLGGVVAIVLGKQIFGGLGNAPFHPAVVGWVVLKVSYPGHMTSYMEPLTGGAAFTSALAPAQLPLQIVREDLSELMLYPSWDLLMGLKAGGIGEVFVLGVILGGIFLIARRMIFWTIPVAVLVGAGGFSLLAAWVDPEVYSGPLFHLFNGGLMFAAVFLAADRGTAPVTPAGRILSGLTLGIITMIIRYWGGYAEGVYFAVLLTNALAPIFDRIRPTVYGRVKEVA